MTTMTDELTLTDIPDLSDLPSASQENLEKGWYKGVVLEERTYTDKNGNSVTRSTQDTVSQKGDSRNISLLVQLTRQSDGRIINQTLRLNYRPEVDFGRVGELKELGSRPDYNENPDLFRSFLALTQLRSLFALAGVRQLQRTRAGGFDLTPLYGAEGYFRLGQEKGSEYLEIKDFSKDAPRKARIC